MTDTLSQGSFTSSLVQLPAWARKSHVLNVRTSLPLINPHRFPLQIRSFSCLPEIFRQSFIQHGTNTLLVRSDYLFISLPVYFVSFRFVSKQAGGSSAPRDRGANSSHIPFSYGLFPRLIAGSERLSQARSDFRYERTYGWISIRGFGSEDVCD